MNYLFFDIECANCYDSMGKICEFGYVLTDENLSTIESDILLINPNSQFEQYVIWKIVQYKVKDYLNSPKYPDMYAKIIKRLLELPDTILVGHGVSNDVKFLHDEAKRYSLDMPKLDVVDASVIWQHYNGDKQPRNLKKLVNELGIGESKSIHNSEYDAKMTLEYIKILCERSRKTFAELINTYFSSEEREKLQKIGQESAQKLPSSKQIKSITKQNRMSRSTLRLLVDKIEPIGEISDTLAGKSVAISDNYTNNHFGELLKIIGIIKAHGGSYEFYAERGDIFCTYEKFDNNGKAIKDKKLDFVTSAIKNGKHIEKLPLASLLSSLGINFNSLDTLPPVDIEKLLLPDSKIKITT